MVSQGLLGLVVALLIIECIRRFSRNSRKPPFPLPPGPVPLPFVGNLLDVDVAQPALTLRHWSKKYGDIVYARALHKEFVILNSEEVATALLEQQKYSDRPVFAAADLQLQKAYELINHLLDDPASYAAHFATFSAVVVVEVIYGYHIDVSDWDTFVRPMQRAADIVLHAMRIEAITLCDAFPFIKTLPAWLPGMAFKTDAAECRRLLAGLSHSRYEWAKQQVRDGLAVPCMVTNAIIQHRLVHDSADPEVGRALRESAQTMCAASLGTTNGTLMSFVYLMMNHPEVQQRAQAEIDTVVGRQRLPDFEDRASLPYVDAIIRETMRLHPTLPVGGPRATMEDDVYRGYYIPKGAIVVVNIRGILRNETKYPNPDVFMPERFLRDDGTLNDDNISLIFGFGRRFCPGKYVVGASLWSAIVCMLASFRIEKMEGSDEVKWTTGITSHPLPFPCKFLPRDGMDDRKRKLAALSSASHVQRPT